MSVGALADHPSIKIKQPGVSKRMSKLADHDLVIPLGNGVYQISDEGSAYLREEYDVEKGRYIENIRRKTDTHESGIDETGTNGV